MPPRRSRRFQAQEPSSTNIASLSDDLLAKCFAPLSQKDRLRGAAFVCRHWLEVTTRPELLRELEFERKWKPATSLPAAHSLLRWLLRHAPGVRSLTVCILNPLEHDQMPEFLSLLDGWLALCSGGLEKLYMSLIGVDYTLGGWILTAPNLQALSIDTLHSWLTLRNMTALQRLHVSAGQWHLSAAVQLPTSLTRLSISGHWAEQMPSQVAALTNLRSLELFLAQYSSASMASLARLTSLQHASFRLCKLPDCLAELKGLQTLEISEPSEEPAAVAASLDSALRQLTQLTGLWLDGLPSCNTVPPSLAALNRLQWFYLWSRNTPHGQAEAVLPLGPWQRSLCHLATTYTLARHNLQFLSGAERLQRLSFLEAPALQAGADEQWHAFWRWAGQHKPLQRIGLNPRKEVEPAVMEVVQQLQALRPEMRIDMQPRHFGSGGIEFVVEWK